MIPSTPRSFARRGAEVHVRVLALGVRRREHRGMYLFIEAWTPRPAWLALTPEERTAYVGRVGEGVAQAGWYELFDQVDFGGEAGPPESVLGHHIALQGHPA
jgi:hypothetical protein